jgi:hypothetical protein
MSDLPDMIDQSPEIDELRRVTERLQRQLAQAKAKQEALIDAIYRAARDAAITVGPPATIKPPAKDTRRRNPEHALIHATDWQMGKHTPSYSTEICEQRILRFANKVQDLTDIQRADHPVKHATVMFGGDMVEGITVFPGQAWEVDSTLFEQLFRCARLMARFVEEMLATFDTVHVVCEFGNHGRIGRRGDVPGSDNIDRMAYEVARQQVQDDRVTWQMSASWHQIVTVGNYRAMLAHGDEIKSFGGNTPAFGILRKANAWRSGVTEPFHDLYLGHFHTPMTLTTASGGQVYVTGSPESENAYAVEFVAATGRPSQRLHFIDPERARVAASYLVWLD